MMCEMLPKLLPCAIAAESCFKNIAYWGRKQSSPAKTQHAMAVVCFQSMNANKQSCMPHCTLSSQ